jgi:hypothetical protein
MQLRLSRDSISRLFKAHAGKSADVSPWHKHGHLSTPADHQDESSSSGETIGRGPSEHGDSGTIAPQSALPVSFTCPQLASPEMESPSCGHSGELSPSAHVTFPTDEEASTAVDPDVARGAARHTFSPDRSHRMQMRLCDAEVGVRARRKLWPSLSSSESSEEGEVEEGGETLALASDGSVMSDEQLACMIAHSLTPQKVPRERRHRRHRKHHSRDKDAGVLVEPGVVAKEDWLGQLPLSHSACAIDDDGHCAPHTLSSASSACFL